MNDGLEKGTSQMTIKGSWTDQVQREIDRYTKCEGLAGIPCALRYLGRRRVDGTYEYHFGCWAHTEEEGYYDEDGHPNFREASCDLELWISESGDVDDVG